ncbi:MAG: flagellar basal body P-ring formation chaperone FlgA [Armatimonadota bacterium]
MKCAILLLLVALIALVTCAAAHSSAMAKVTLRPESEVQPAHAVKLQDIACIEAPRELAARIGDISVGSGPLPGQRRSVGSDYIKVKLKTARLEKDVKLIGPKKVDIVGMCIKLSADELSEQVKAFVADQLPKDGMTYEVETDRAPREIVIAQGGDVQVRPRLMSTTLRPGVNTVVVDVLVDGKTAATTSTALTVKAVAEVMVATGTIRQGEALTPSNTTWERRDVTRNRDVVVHSDAEACQDWIARRTIQSGSVITSQSVEQAPTVKRGDTVSLVVKCGNVILHTTAEVKQDGRAGDTIRVQSAVSKSEVRARVVEPGLVEIVR